MILLMQSIDYIVKYSILKLSWLYPVFSFFDSKNADIQLK